MSAKSILALIFFFSLSANRLNAQTVTLTTTVDAIDGNTANIAALIGTPGGAGISLREAIIAANNEPAGAVITINIPAGNHTLTIAGAGENAAATGDLDVNHNVAGTKTVNIVGVSAATSIITGMATDRIFDVHSITAAGAFLTFNISNVTLTGANVTGSAGAILAGRAGDITTITNCIFAGNTASTIGGAVSQSSGAAVHDLTITNCTFTGNTATTATGGAVNYNGLGNVSITGCTFTGNLAGTQGGAINITGTGAGPVTTNILRNTITGNTASGGTFGGAAVAMVNAQTINTNFNRIVNNTAPGVANGKMISTGGGTVTTMNNDNNWWGVNTGPAAADILGTAAANWLQLKLTASPTSLSPGGTSTVTASFLTNSANNAVAVPNLATVIGLPITFSATLGTLSSAQPTIQATGTATVTYTAGGTNGTGTVNGVVDNVPNSETAPARASITITCPTITVTNPVVSSGIINTPFSQTFTASGGAPGYTFTTASVLPTGLTLSAGGVLSGTPTQAGTFPITVTATDVNGCFGSGAVYNLNIASCIPATTNGCANGDSLTYFSLKGASGTVIYNESGATCSGSPLAYSDYTSAFAAVTLVRGEGFGGFMRTGNANDYATIWIDANDNGVFENSERLMNNLQIGTVKKLYSLHVPAAMALGTHRLRVRVVHYASPPAAVTDPCALYANGETEDYLVTLTNVGSTHGVAAGTPGSCMVGGEITIGAASNNNPSGPVYIVDSLNNYICAVYPNGNNLGTVKASYYVHNGAVRQDAAGRYYLDRNITVTVGTQPASAYNLRYFYLNSELNALIAQPGSGVTSQFDLNTTKTATNTCQNQFVTNLSAFVSPTGFGSLSGDRFLDFTGLTSFSSFFLHGGATVLTSLALPPTINVVGSLALFTTCSGTASAEQSFTVSGSNLTADIVVTPPAGFEISLTSGSGFTGSISLTPASGSVPVTTIYVRLSASAVGSPSGNITCASTGATTQNVPASGVVTAGPTTANAGPDAGVCGTLTTTLAGNTATNGTGTWTQVSGPGTSSFTNANSPASGVTVTLEGAYTFRWTIATGAPCADSQDDVVITFAAAPTSANAGPDLTRCGLPASAVMAGNTATVGTGTWTQTAGPVPATIVTPGSPTTNITGMTAAGTYTFRWTISNAPCPDSFDEMDVVVSPNPAAFTITGGGTFCPPGTTLTGPVDPNYTYQWGRSLLAAPFTNLGTSQTQAVTVSGNYQLTVTNQFGCSTSATTIVNVADYVFNGSLGAGDPQQTGRINRFAQISTCASPKACPGLFTPTGARFYDSYTITNIRNVPVCATIGHNSGCGTNAHCVAYLGSFDPSNPCTNYLGDAGSSPANSIFFEVTIPANSSIVVVVHEVNPGAGCANYTLTVDVPRDPAAINVSPTPPVCSGVTVTLTAPVANTYSWNPGGATTQAINVTPTTTTNYDVTLGYGNNGCTNNIGTSVTVNPVATANAGPDDATCGLTYPALAANTPVVGTGAWSQVSGPGTSTFTNGSSPTSGVTVTANGIYVFRWTVTAGAPCPGTAQDDVQINFAGDPSTANAGTDKTACVSPGTTTMTATAPTVGTGVWTQVAGPVTTNIISPALFNTTITGLNTTGTYTFRWTVSNAPCNANFDDVDVVVNSNPATPTITGGGTFCPPGTTLTGPVDPNYTYQWGRSLLAAPFTNLGTSQTQAVTASGNYQLTVTNQFGCSASAVTVVNVADYVFNGSLAAGDAQQTGRLNRFAQISTCASPKACPGTFTTTGARFYDAYTITNIRNVPVCATIGLNSGCGTAVFSVAYSGSFNPTALCTNYLADPGSSPSASIFYEATIPANGTIVVVVHEVNPGQLCANYTLTVDVPREAAAITAVPPAVICNGTSTLTASVANSYLWSPGGQTTQSIVTPPLFSASTFNVTLGYGNNGCTDIASTTVTVASAPPSVTCPADITVSNTTGQCGAIVTYSTTVTGTPAPTVTYSFIGATTGSGSGDGSGSFFNVGITTVTVTVTNPCGTTSCTFTITVNDVQAPTLTCPAPITVSCAAAVPVANIALVTGVTDNCPSPVSITWQGDVISNQTCANRYTVTRTYRATDVSSNFTECTQIITVDDQTPPVLTCPAPVTVSCAADVPAPNIALVTGVSDNCAGVVTVTHVSDVISNQTCANRYTVTRTYRATDVCGNFAECTQIITVDDQTPPVLTCPAPVTVSCAAAVPAPNIALVTGVSDNCAGVVTITHVSDVISNQTCANRYTITRTYRATDVCGNFAECTQIITVNDQTPPVLTCPAPVTVSCAAAVPAPNIALVTGVSDNCAGVVTVTHVSDVISNQTCANRYTITRTYRATDVCGNFAECTQIITVNDQTPPVLTCPAPVTVSCAAAVPAPNIASVTGVSDNCAGVVTVTHVSDVISNQTCANRYTITRTYRATDVCGNFAECTQIITVNDQTPPVITCPAAITVSCASAVPAPNTASVTATDNCAGVITITHISDVITNQTCANRFTLTRRYRATDVCGNFSECTQIITVNDQTPPVITCPANITVNTPVGSCTAVVNFTVTATDNCGAVTVVSVPASGSVFPIGTTTVTSTATDACGMTATCTFTVTVNDVQLPVITAQPANRTVCVGTTAVFSVTAITSPSANGPLAYQWQLWNTSTNTWGDIAGATASTLTLTNVTHSMNANSYRVRVIGLCTTIISNHATLRVNPLPTISISTSIQPTLLPTQTVILTANGNPGGGTYVWFKNNVVIPGATSQTLGPLGIADLGTYKVTYTDPNGCVNTSADVVVKAQPSSGIVVYPNPNNGQFNVRFYNTTSQFVTVYVFNVVGQRMLLFSEKYPVTSQAYNTLSVRMRQFVAAGTYEVMVLDDKNQRIDIERIVVANQ